MTLSPQRAKVQLHIDPLNVGQTLAEADADADAGCCLRDYIP